MSADRISNFIEQGLSQAAGSVRDASANYQSDVEQRNAPQLDETCTGRSLQSLREKLVPVGSVRQVWFEHLVPQLQRLEHDRVAAKIAHQKRAGPIKVACIIGAVISFMYFGMLGPFAAAAVYAFLTYETLTKLNQQGQRTKRLLVTAACEIFGFTYHPAADALDPGYKLGAGKTGLMSQFRMLDWARSLKGNRPAHAVCPTPALDVMQRYSLFKKPDRTSFDDGVSGERAGAKFSMIEAHLQRYEGSGKHRRLATVFQGVLIHIEYPRRFLGTTVISRRGKGKRVARKHDLKPVDIVAPAFENRFDVCSDDQTEARFLLTPDRLMRLIALDDYFSGRDLQAVFEDGHLTIAISTPDLFEVGDAWNGLVDQSRFADCLHELGLICDVVDGYLTRDWVQGRLPPA